MCPHGLPGLSMHSYWVVASLILAAVSNNHLLCMLQNLVNRKNGMVMNSKGTYAVLMCHQGSSGAGP